jgi:hypothetical protein
MGRELLARHVGKITALQLLGEVPVVQVNGDLDPQADQRRPV